MCLLSSGRADHWNLLFRSTAARLDRLLHDLITLSNKMDKPLKSKIAIVGLGYVGLALVAAVCALGVHVLGIDIDPDKVDALNEGRSYIKHVPGEVVAEQVKAGRLAATTDFARVKEVDAVIICVPTPLNKNREPDISFILQTGRAIAPHLRPGTLVALESTTYPGTTDEDLRAVLEAGSGLKAGKDFHLAFSPEREDPANPASKVGEVPKLVGGLTPACLERPCRSMVRRSRRLCLFHPVALPKRPSFWKTSFAV